MQREDVVAEEMDAEEASEVTSLVQVELDEATLKAERLSRRRLLRGSMLALGGLCGSMALMKIMLKAPCAPKGAPVGHSFISLAETYPQELVSFGPEGTEADALLGWLAAANSAGAVAENSATSATSPSSEDQLKIMKEATDAIQEALKGNDPKQAAKVAEEAMIKAVGRNKEKRQQLKDLASKLDLSRVIGSGGRVGGIIGGKPLQKTYLKVKAKIATCIFDLLSMTTGVAALGSNINDVAKTCEGVAGDRLIHSQKNDIHAKVCAVNVAAMVAGFANLATNLAAAADECARTLIPNVDALCSAAVTGLLTSMSSLAGSFTLIAASCRKEGWYNQIPPGLTPSNVGSNDWQHIETPYDHRPARRLRDGGAFSQDDEIVAPAAPPRKLLFGGGKSSLATQCATEIMGVAWALAYFGLAINSMTNEEKGASCPPHTDAGGEVDKVSQALCAVDVTSAMLSFFQVIAYANLIAVTCTDVLDLGAICGAGITGVFAGATGIAKASTGLYLACDVGQEPIVRDVTTLGRELDWMTGYKISDIIDNGMGATVDTSIDGAGNFGRRLQGMGLSEETMADLKEQYGSPENVWKSIGYDFADPTAEWRSAVKEAKLAPEDYDLLIQKEERREPKRGSGGFFAPDDICED